MSIHLKALFELNSNLPKLLEVSQNYAKLWYKYSDFPMNKTSLKNQKKIEKSVNLIDPRTK